MKDPNKFHPGCENENCWHYKEEALLNCNAIQDIYISDTCERETPHEFACSRLTCYRPHEVLERFKIEYWNLGAEKRVKILDRYAGKEHTIESLIEALNHIDPNGLKL